MKDDDIDDVLKRAADASPEVDPALLDRVSRSIGASLRPVRPLPPPSVLATALAAVCLGVASAGGAALGLHGVQQMSAPEIAVIFPLLAVLAGLAALVSVGQAIPGSRHRVTPGTLLAAGCVSLVGVFALLFHEYRLERFWSQGLKCLAAGLGFAIPAALVGWLVLRRGFAVNSVAAGFAQGTLAGLAGVGMLELHCANFEAPHVLLWHTAVLPLSAAAGALLGWAGRRTASR